MILQVTFYNILLEVSSFTDSSVIRNTTEARDDTFYIIEKVGILLQVNNEERELTMEKDQIKWRRFQNNMGERVEEVNKVDDDWTTQHQNNK